MFTFVKRAHFENPWMLLSDCGEHIYNKEKMALFVPLSHPLKVDINRNKGEKKSRNKVEAFGYVSEHRAI